jgi:hypothetical protein
MERALEWAGRTHTLADVAARIKAGKAQWWSNADGMVVTEVNEYPQYRALNYWLIGGKLKDCLAMEPEIERAAIANGCQIATANGRRSWVPVVEPRGWRVHALSFWKPLTEEAAQYVRMTKL